MLVGRQDDEQVTLTILPGNGYRYEPDSLRLMDVDRDNGSQLDITPYMTEITENSVYSIFIGSGDLYVGVRYDYVEDGQSKSFVTGRTLVGIPRAAADGWEQLPDGRWAYLRQMAPVREEWVNDAGKWYWLDSQGMMATGWQLVDGEWYLFGASGAMKAGWQWSAEYNGWYYLRELHDGLYGHMLRSTTTPDGWQVDATGRWVQ
jgi:hypothetical protein